MPSNGITSREQIDEQIGACDMDLSQEAQQVVRGAISVPLAARAALSRHCAVALWLPIDTATPSHWRFGFGFSGAPPTPTLELDNEKCAGQAGGAEAQLAPLPERRAAARMQRLMSSAPLTASRGSSSRGGEE